MGLLLNVLIYRLSYNGFLGPYKLPVLSTGAQLIFLGVFGLDQLSSTAPSQRTCTLAFTCAS